jgi:putative ABC transport system substrate-binding protein
VKLFIPTWHANEVDPVGRRVLLLGFALIHAIAATTARPQESKKTWVVGVLANASSMEEPVLYAFRQRLRELGYVEGENVRIEFRTAQNHVDRLPKLAQELVQLKVDAIFVTNTLAAGVVKQATSTIPIVMIGNPVGSDLILDLAHPGGNVTGVSIVSPELTSKRLQLLKEAIPRLTRVAVLWNPDTPWHAKAIEDLKAVGPALSIELEFVTVRTPEELTATFDTLDRMRVRALYLLESPLFFIHRRKLVDLATKARLPVTYGVRDFADAGALMSYGPNYTEIYRRSADYVDRILKGAKPSDLPMEQPTKFELVLNLKTAKALAIKIPESMLLRADEVIR